MEKGDSSKKEKSKRLIIVQIPAYNESATISSVIREIPRRLNNHIVKVLLIDDGSTDNTVELAKSAGADYVLKHRINRGLGVSFKDGIQKSLELGAEIIVNIDADNQFDPKEIERLVRPILSGEAEMVTGSRFLPDSRVTNMPYARRWGNRRFTNLVNNLTNQNFTDTQCGFRAYSREAALHLNISGRFTYTQEVFLDLASKGLVIKEIPISVTYHAERKSALSGSLTKYGFRTLGIIARATRDRQPLTFFGLPATTIFSLGFLGLAYSFIYWLIHHATTPVKTLMNISIFVMIFGLSLFILAMLADMLLTLKRNQDEVLYRLRKLETISYNHNL